MICDIQGEKWLPVPGFEGIYDVSNKGRVATYRGPGHVLMRTRQRIMSLCLGPNRYRQLVLKSLTRERQVRIHRLVLEVFVGPCSADMEACHRNGDKGDNRISNLKWDSHWQNQMEMHVQTPTSILFRSGEANPSAKLSSREVSAIRAIFATGQFTHDQIAKLFGVSRRCIGRILDRTRRAAG